MSAFDFRTDTTNFKFARPEYDVIQNFSFLNTVHQRAFPAAGPVVAEPVRPPTPPPRASRRLPVVGYIMKPEPTTEQPPEEKKLPPPPKEEAVAPPALPHEPPRRLKPQVYSLTEQITASTTITTLDPLPKEDVAAPPALPPEPPRRLKPQVYSLTEQITQPAHAAPVPECQPEVSPLLSLSSPPPPLPSPPPEEGKMMLPEYCMTLDLNYHQAITTALLEHINGLNADASYRPNILLLTGQSGCGKTFCVRRACQLGGYDLIEMDGIQTDPEEQARSTLTTRPDPFGPHRSKRICVALFEAMDGMDKERRTAVTKIIQAIAGDERSKEKRRTAVRFRVNTVILTVDDRYDPNIRDLVYKLKPTELKVNELTFDQRVALVEKGCAYLGRSMSARIYRLVSSNPDNTSSLLTKVESVLCLTGPDEDESTAVDYTKEEETNSLMKTDDRSMNIFACCRTLLQPPETMNPRTNQYETITFSKYEETWHMGGEKVLNTLFNSYQNFVHYIPETPAPVKTWLEDANETTWADAKQSMRDISSSGNYFYRGLDTMAHLADAFSLTDRLNHAADDSADDLIKRIFKVELQDVVSRNSQNPQIDVKSHLTTYRRPPCLMRCNVQKADEEKFRWVAMMRYAEAQRQIEDFTYQPNPYYDLTKHIGLYWTRSEFEPDKWLQLDMFAEEKRLKKSRKRMAEDAEPETKEDKITPKMECIKLFSHRLVASATALPPPPPPRKKGTKRPATAVATPSLPSSSSEAAAPATEAPASKLMIRLSNGQYVERKPRNKR